MTSSQSGLQWRSSLWGFKPEWTIEPRVDIIERIVRQKLGQLESCRVEFFGQGAFNKLYTVRCDIGDYMMRISLPVDPRYKTLSEVATLDFVWQHTEIPVPMVIAFDASNENDLGFEWMLMEMMPGVPLADVWWTISWSAKQTLAKRLALFTAQLFRKKFTSLGNLYHADERSDGPYDGGTSAKGRLSTGFLVGRIVSTPFFWVDNVKQVAQRGPFRSSQEWLSAHLLFNRNNVEKTLETSDDEDDLEDANETSQNIQKMLSLLPSFFPTDPGQVPEVSALRHDDLSDRNILVDQDGNLTAVLDWECVSALPLWKVCQVPALLESTERHDRPVKGGYTVDDNGEVNQLYWIHLEAYERTQLRALFLQEMERIEPEWIKTSSMASTESKTDFELAVLNCDGFVCWKAIHEWLEDAMKTEVSQLWSLEKRMHS